MNKSRLLLCIFLGCLLLVVVSLLAAWYWTRRPAYLLGRAQDAIEKEDYETARLFLMKLIQKDPDHAQGNELLSDVILLHAREIGRVPSFAANPKAVDYLEHAAELRPDDKELQIKLLRACVLARQFGRATEIAAPIYQADKTNANAHFVLTYAAVTADDKEKAERLFAEAGGVQGSRHVFQEIELRFEFYRNRKDVRAMNEAIREALTVAAKFNEEQLRLLTASDREVMLQILATAQRSATGTQLAQKISNLIIKLCRDMRSAKLMDDELLSKMEDQSRTMPVGGGVDPSEPDDDLLLLRDESTKKGP